MPSSADVLAYLSPHRLHPLASIYLVETDSVFPDTRAVLALSGSTKLLAGMVLKTPLVAGSLGPGCNPRL